MPPTLPSFALTAWSADVSRPDRLKGRTDLAVEIVSPNDLAGEVQEKVQQWLDGGAVVVWVLYPATRGVVIWRANGATPELRGTAEVDAEPILPGFRCRADELFGTDDA